MKHPEKALSWIKEKAQKATKLDSKSGPDRSLILYIIIVNTYPLTLSDWVVDTRVSKHTYNNLDLFNTIDLSPGHPLVLIAVGPIALIGYGTVKLDISVLSGTHQLIIRNILYIPIFPCNLFSALQLLLNRGRIYTKHMAIFDKKQTLISRISISQEGLKLRLTGSGYPP